MEDEALAAIRNLVYIAVEMLGPADTVAIWKAVGDEVSLAELSQAVIWLEEVGDVVADRTQRPHTWRTSEAVDADTAPERVIFPPCGVPGCCD